MAIKKSRQMKVYGQSGYHYKSTPAIMLRKDSGLRSWDLKSEIISQ